MCDGDGGGEEVGVDVGVTKSSEFARECDREVGAWTCSWSGNKLSFPVTILSSSFSCSTS